MLFPISDPRLHIVVEPEAFDGVRRIAAILAKDIQAVTGILPPVTTDAPGCPAVVCMTLGCSPEADRLAQAGTLDRAQLEGRREVYQLRLQEDRLLICGSDKRGTIYGMFALSEYLGVSPLSFWGDAAPVRRENAVIGPDIETVSKEPAVKYRGFFINDEWPCFGTWAHSHYGGVNAACYEPVFELLLRMKGNYLWPAMWNSSFPLDGPGSANEELADTYGVIMGYSHHEPCLRASEEWDKVRGEDTAYGNEWNYYTNEPGLLRYWEDALKRSGKYENIITIGMRGERDSSMLGPDATLAENIELLKKIILKQRALIEANVPRKAPQMLALYKEVERYFYGDAATPGLRSWQELDDVIWMLCEDNFGHLRTVPPEDLRDHPGGWGMYYHLDYHGGPVSYEWVDSTPLNQIREQMMQAWDCGIRELWIVNVGDLKLHEVGLGYFLSLACDPDIYGSPDGPGAWMRRWARQSFPASSPAIQEAAARIYTDFVSLNSLRRPEALHAGIYHPVHYHETRRMLDLAQGLEDRIEALQEAMPEADRAAFYSMAAFPGLASANLLKLHLYAGLNQHYAAQGKVYANRLAQLCEECIRRDTQLSDAFSRFKGGKWAGMELASHIGFTRWNDDDARYPLLTKVTPMPRSCMKVSRLDDTRIAVRTYGGPMSIEVPDFLSAGCRQVPLEIACGGGEPIDFVIRGENGPIPQWLTVSPEQGTAREREVVTLTCLREKLPGTAVHCSLIVEGADTRVRICIDARRIDVSTLPECTWLPRNGVTVIPADGYFEIAGEEGLTFEHLTDYGKYGTGLKAVPAVPSQLKLPGLRYRFLAEQSGKYTVTVLTAPNNPIGIGTPVRVLLKTDSTACELTLLDEQFRAGENSDARWCRGVLDQIHTAQAQVHFESGIRELTLQPMDPGIVLEQLWITAPGAQLRESYLGPEISFRSDELL